MATITSETKLPILVTPLPGPNAKKVIARDAQFVSPSYTRGYPLVAKSGRGAMVEDVDGNLFLDFAAGIAVVSTGHCHPRVVEAIQKQAAELIHISGTDFYLPEHGGSRRAPRGRRSRQGAEESLLRQLGHGSDRSGHQAGAVSHAARQNHRVSRLLSWTHARRAFADRFEGRAAQGIRRAAGRRVSHSLSEFVPLPVWQSVAVHLRRGGHVSGDAKFSSAWSIPTEVAAVFIEPIQGEGGYVPAPKEFLLELQRICRKHGILLVCDEVQSGMGRTGKWWAGDHAGIEPDILCVAKGIASGMPLSATIARASLMDWKPGAHASTFGGNPVCVAAALATMDLLETQYIENARRVGEFLMGRMADWPARHKIVGDVRGKGLMIGVEIVRDQKTKERARDLREAIVDRAFEKGLLLLGAGENTIRIAPPLVIDEEQADFAARTLEACIGEIEKLRVSRNS